MEYRKILEKAGKIHIRPYTNPKRKNMGLENYEMVVHAGVKHTPTIAAISQNGKTQYITGLNEYAPDILSIKDKEEQDAKILEIREIVAELEKHKNFTNLDVNDPDFWSKVQTYRPDNSEIWSSAELLKSLGNDPIRLDPVGNINDLLFIRIVEAGGIPEIAKSKADAAVSQNRAKWFLDRETITAQTNTTISRAKNKALSFLNELFDREPNKLLYIAKILNPSSTQYKLTTAPDTFYEFIDDYVNGRSVEGSIKTAVKNFTELAEMSMQDLKIKAIVKDAMVFRYLQVGADQNIYTHDDRVRVGKSLNDAFVFLKNPINEDVLIKLMTDVEKVW